MSIVSAQWANSYHLSDGSFFNGSKRRAFDSSKLVQLRTIVLPKARLKKLEFKKDFEDQITLKDGNILYGKVERKADSVVLVSSKYLAGQKEFSTAQIKKIKRVEFISVRMPDNKFLRGNKIQETKHYIEFAYLDSLKGTAHVLANAMIRRKYNFHIDAIKAENMLGQPNKSKEMKVLAGASVFVPVGFVKSLFDYAKGASLNTIVRPWSESIFTPAIAVSADFHYSTKNANTLINLDLTLGPTWSIFASKKLGIIRFNLAGGVAWLKANAAGTQLQGFIPLAASSLGYAYPVGSFELILNARFSYVFDQFKPLMGISVVAGGAYRIF